MNSHPKNYFIERLTLGVFLFYIFPKLFVKKRPTKVYFIDGGKKTEKFSQWVLRVFGVQFEKLKFRLVDIRDENYLLLRLRIAYFDFTEVSNHILKNKVFQSPGIQHCGKRISIFLEKQIANYDLKSNETLWRALLLVQIVLWKVKQENQNPQNAVLFMTRKVWQREINRYAVAYHLDVVAIHHWLDTFLKLLSIHILAYRRFCKDIFFFLFKKGWRAVRAFKEKSLPQSPLLLVEYYGHLNLDQPKCQSDLFFYRQSQLSAQDILLAFYLPSDPLNPSKWSEIRKHGLHAVALDLRAKTEKRVPVFYHWPKKSSLFLSSRQVRPMGTSLERLWLMRQTRIYCSEYNYWVDFFKQSNTKIYLSWYIYSAIHCVMADALESLGGVTALYQRACYEFPSNETRLSTDIFFAFSQKGLALEQAQRSRINYHVVTGYLSDYLFPLLSDQAKIIRAQLQKNGARRIIAFFDEGSADDSRWHTGHEFMRDNYVFLLEKMLSDPKLGLIFKPKAPSSLRERLGPVMEMLERACQTRRCYVVEGGRLHGSYPPALAAIAADIAIHGHLCAATAGVESALTGTPTLLLDREGWSLSSLYELGEGKVVFKNWTDLWATYQQYCINSEAIPGFGDWGPSLDEFDPFRDGRAAERIGTYLNWLLEGFKAKLPRETVMADAAERYGKCWGFDKISTVPSKDKSARFLNKKPVEQIV